MRFNSQKPVAPAERRTPQRDAIQHVLEKASGPLSPQQILHDAQTEMPQLGIATVYRAVKDLSEEHAVAAICLADGTLRYELRKAGHHHHFHCEDCDRVYDIPAQCDGLDASLPKGFVVERHEVLIFGRCSGCRSAQNRRVAR